MNLKKRKLRNSEYIQYINDFVTICEKHPDVKSALSTTLTPLKEQLEKMYQASKTKDLELTGQLFELDSNRDQTYKGIRLSVKANTLHWKETISTSAHKVLEYMDRHIKSINTLNYPSETEKLKTLISTLRLFEEQDGVLTNLNILKWTNKLEEYNNLFNDLYITRNTADTEYDSGTVTEFRIETYTLHDNLLNLLFGLIVTKTAVSEDISLFLDTQKEIDQLTSKFNDIQSLRNNSNSTEDEV